MKIGEISKESDKSVYEILCGDWYNWVIKRGREKYRKIKGVEK